MREVFSCDCGDWAPMNTKCQRITRGGRWLNPFLLRQICDMSIFIFEDFIWHLTGEREAGRTEGGWHAANSLRLDSNHGHIHDTLYVLYRKTTDIQTGILASGWGEGEISVRGPWTLLMLRFWSWWTAASCLEWNISKKVCVQGPATIVPSRVLEVMEKVRMDSMKLPAGSSSSDEVTGLRSWVLMMVPTEVERLHSVDWEVAETSPLSAPGHQTVNHL